MICEICNNESNIIYATSKYGLICSKCMSRIKNSGDEKLKQYQEELEMYKRYGLSVNDLEEKIRCLKEKNGYRPK